MKHSPVPAVLGNNIPRVTKITFGVFKFLFGVIVNTFGETISIYNIGCQSPVPVASVNANRLVIAESSFGSLTRQESQDFCLFLLPFRK